MEEQAKCSTKSLALASMPNNAAELVEMASRSALSSPAHAYLWPKTL